VTGHYGLVTLYLTNIRRTGLRPKTHIKSGLPDPSTDEDAWPPPHHGLVTFSRVDIRVLLLMGTLNMYRGGVPVSGMKHGARSVP
jgi:hypothetical protein